MSDLKRTKSYATLCVNIEFKNAKERSKANRLLEFDTDSTAADERRHNIEHMSNLFNNAAGFKERYLSWKSWQQWCMSFIFSEERRSYAGQDDLNGESPAIEVLKYKDPEGYFGDLTVTCCLYLTLTCVHWSGERQLAKERRDRERLDLAKRKQKDLELKQKMEKIKELEKKRMLEEERRRQELKERERAIQSIVNKHNMVAHTVITELPKPNLNSMLTVEQPINSQEKMPNPDSYEMTPAKTCFPKKVSLESYDISDLHSDDSTDEDEAPKKKVPTWALGASLKAALIQQHYHPPDLNTLFTEIEPPDLNELFVKKKARFNKRTSSAIWNSPILKPGLN
ncbi:inner centromere protein-like [Ostrea edulis]|uniref:inner centromere protein-like n=1 Tax=Ostrea edulis TaxID=37623 RepID=UPI0024AFE41E|nr:inner centromere protein-like [Ostrea edulis]